MAKSLKEMDEIELRDHKVEGPRSKDDLLKVIDDLTERPHDYGTCVYAMSIAATATFEYVAHVLGVTGFQASCADMDILRRTRRMETFKIVNYDNLLYPQYEHQFTEGYAEAIKKNAKWLKEKATALLAENDGAHPNVHAHWKILASLPANDDEE